MPFENKEKLSQHPFQESPNLTLVRLALPVLFSLIAEPLTGLADTAFIARLTGPEPVAALGIGSMAFSSLFWVFAFLGIGTQTQVARNEGGGGNSVKVTSLASMVALCLGFVLIAASLPLLDTIATLFGAYGVVNDLACKYMAYRLLGAPAVLVSLVCFGALRGVQDMRTPLLAALGINAINFLLDWVLIFGNGPFPMMGVSGAALASSVSQWGGALWLLLVVRKKIGLTWKFKGAGIVELMQVGGDLFIRTGVLLFFFGLCTRVANGAGADQGAAYQAIRQFYIFSALTLDAYAITGQSLVGYFLGRGDTFFAHRVAVVVCRWSIVTGCVVCLAMLLGKDFVAWLLVPATAVGVFGPAWSAAALSMPLGSLSFATDGLHWGSGDFRYLRNAMVISSVLCVIIVFFVDAKSNDVVYYIWLVTILWTLLRAGFGIVRIWPGVGDAPLSKA